MKTIVYIDRDHDYYGVELVAGFVQEAKKYKWWHTLIIPHLEELDDKAKALISDADAVVTKGVTTEMIGAISLLNSSCLTLRSASSIEVTEAPHVDDREIGRIAYEELCGLGLAHYAFLGYEGIVWSEARRDAFFENTGIENSGAENTGIYEELLLSADTVDSVVQLAEVKQWLEDQPKPVAIFAASDDLAAIVVQAALLCGIDIPQEVAVIGVDNNPHLCDNAVVTLSSVEFHMETIGRRCAWVLAKDLGLIDSESNNLASQPILRPPELVIRESSHQVTKHFVVYRRAMSWLNRHALTGPSVDELAEASSVSRRSLERIFAKIAKMSPARAIREKRIKAILYLLSMESLPLAQLAHLAGFPDQASFSNFVYRNMGDSPSSLRLKGVFNICFN